DHVRLPAERSVRDGASPNVCGRIVVVVLRQDNRERRPAVRGSLDESVRRPWEPVAAPEVVVVHPYGKIRAQVVTRGRQERVPVTGPVVRVIVEPVDVRSTAPEAAVVAAYKAVRVRVRTPTWRPRVREVVGAVALGGVLEVVEGQLRRAGDPH